MVFPDQLPMRMHAFRFLALSPGVKSLRFARV